MYTQINMGIKKKEEVRNMGQYVEQNLNRNETVVKKADLNPLKLMMSWIGGILFFWLLIPLIKAIKATITYVYTELAVTNKRVVGKAGFINSASLDAPLNKIQNASVSSGLWGKIFNYGTLTIHTASGVFKFDGIKNADSFKGILMNQIDEYEEDKIKEQAKQMAAAMKAAQE